MILRWNRSFPGKDSDSGDRRRCEKIREKVFHILGDRSDSAEKICRKLKEQAFPFHLEELEEAFHFDDHTLWDTCTGEKGKRTKEKWNKLLSYTAANRQDHRKRRGSQKGDQKEETGTVRSGRYDYKNFSVSFLCCGKRWNWIRKALIIFL